MPLWLLSILSGAGKLIRKAFDWIADDPWRLFVIVSAVLAVLWWRADARADRLQDALMALREASERVRDADKAAARKGADVAAKTKTAGEKGNDNASKAADGSDEPLSDAFARPRPEKGPVG